MPGLPRETLFRKRDRQAVFLLGAGSGLAAVGYAIWRLTASPTLGLALLVGAVVVIMGALAALDSGARATSLLSLAGPTAAPVPRSDSDPGAVRWTENRYRSHMVRLDGIYRSAYWMVGIALAVDTALLALGFSRVWDAPPLHANPVLFMGAETLLLPAFFVSRVNRERALTSPLRVGLSDGGIHVEYGPGFVRDEYQMRVNPDFLPWDRISGLIAPSGFNFQGKSYYVTLARVEGGSWWINHIDPGISTMLAEAWAERKPPG